MRAIVLTSSAALSLVALIACATSPTDDIGASQSSDQNATAPADTQQSAKLPPPSAKPEEDSGASSSGTSGTSGTSGASGSSTSSSSSSGSSGSSGTSGASGSSTSSSSSSSSSSS